MNKGRRGNKEVKKPKKAPVPRPEGLPELVPPASGGTPRPRKG